MTSRAACRFDAISTLGILLEWGFGVLGVVVEVV